MVLKYGIYVAILNWEIGLLKIISYKAWYKL